MSLWNYRSPFSLAGLVMFILAVAGVRACARAGFPVWAGLFSLTFGTVFILVGALLSSGVFGWAIAIAAIATGIFMLDLALLQSVEAMLAMGLRRTQMFWILALVCFTGAVLGWAVPVIIGT